MTNIVEAGSSDFNGPLSDMQVIQCGHLLREASTFTVEALIAEALDWESKSVTLAQLNGMTGNLLHWYPLMAVSRGQSILYVNLHEAIWDADLLEDVLNLDIDVNQNKVLLSSTLRQLSKMLV